MLTFKPHLNDIVERHRKLWSREMPDGILARLDPAEVKLLDPLSFAPDIPAMALAWEDNYRARKAVEDDLLPVARVSFGSSAYGAYLGAEVTFTGGAGWSKPSLPDYSQIEHIGVLEYTPGAVEWQNRQREACHYFVEAARGKFALCETEPMEGLNLVEVLRGSATYTDLYDHPDELRQLMDFGGDFNIRFTKMQRAILSPCLRYQDGIFSLFRIWLPGQPAWLSVDAYGLCSPAVFRRFGLEYLQRTIDYFSGGWVHMHASGVHLLPLIKQLKPLLGIGIADDPNQPRAFEKLDEIRAITGDIPLQIDCTAEELEQGMKDRSLPGGTMYMVKSGIETVDQANRLMEKVRDYRR